MGEQAEHTQVLALQKCTSQWGLNFFSRKRKKSLYNSFLTHPEKLQAGNAQGATQADKEQCSLPAQVLLKTLPHFHDSF